MRVRLIRRLALGVAVLIAWPIIASAATLTMAVVGEPSSIDPHFSRTANNQMAAQHLFDRLAETDANLQLHPALATEWKNIDPLTWEVSLRPGVTFHDGSPMTAEDVVYSMERAKDIPNSPAPFTGQVSFIARMDIVDPLTIRFTTKEPTPLFIERVGLVFIVSKHLAQGKRIEDFNTGAAAIGTGPYKYKEWVPGDHLTLVRNEAYWGKKPAFDTVVVRYISNPAARVAALRSGSVDLIEGLSSADVAALKSAPGITLFSIASARIIYMALDSSRDASPFITGADGKPLSPNPLKDRRVRLALSKLINRPLLIDRVLDGAGEAAGQMVPDGIGGYAADLKAEAYDVAGAKVLLAEAGYKDGFGITLHSSSDRFAGDSAVAQAIGQLFARAGLKVNGVVTQPYNVYATAASRRDYSAFLFSFGTTTPNALLALNNNFATFDKDKGTGAFNRTRYSNPEFDAVLDRAVQEFDTDKRNALLADATRIAMKDVAVIPLYWPKFHWATRGNITYAPTRSEETLAMFAGVKP